MTYQITKAMPAARKIAVESLEPLMSPPNQYCAFSFSVPAVTYLLELVVAVVGSRDIMNSCVYSQEFIFYIVINGFE